MQDSQKSSNQAVNTQTAGSENVIPDQTFAEQTLAAPEQSVVYTTGTERADSLLQHVTTGYNPEEPTLYEAAKLRTSILGKSIGQVIAIAFIFIFLVIGIAAAGVLQGTRNNKSGDGQKLLSSAALGSIANQPKDQQDDSILQINTETVVSGGKKLTATGDVLVQSTANSANAFKIQNANGANILVADTENNQINIGNKPPGDVSLNVQGDITTNGALVSTAGYSLSSQGLNIGGVLVCTANGCVSSSSPSPTPKSPSIDVANLAFLNKGQIYSGSNTFNGPTTFGAVTTFNAPVQVAGNVNSTTGFSVGGVNGSSLSCGPGELLQQAVVSGGIITSGSCVVVSGVATPTLQQVYDASTPATIGLSSASGALQIQDSVSPLGTNLFDVTNNSGATTYFAVNSLGISVTGNVNTTGQYQVGGSQISSANLSNDANLAKLNGNQTFSGNNTFSSASNSFTGSGAGLSNVNAAQLNGQAASFYTNATNISTGTLNDARLSNNVALLNALQTFSGANTFSNVSNSFSGSGAGLTSLNASNVSSGSLNDARLSANVTLLGNTFNGANQLVQLTAGGILPILSGANLTSLNATNISSGSLSDARLSNNVALKNANNSFSGNNTFTLSSAALNVQDASSPLAGNLFQVTDNTGATKYFEVSATGVKINGNDVCTAAGNCTGVAGGSIGGSGTAGKLAKFTGSGYTIGDSLISDNGTTITVAGNINTTGQYQVGGSQISSANLSNDANLAKLNGNQTFSGNNTFSSASNSFTGSGAGLSSLNASNISSGSLNDARLSNNVALLNANQTFSGNNKFSLNTAGLAVQDAASPLGTNLFEVTDNAGTTKYFTVSATSLQFNGNDVCTAAGNCTGVAGGSIGGSGTAGKLAKFTGSGYTIGDSLISENGSTVSIGGVLGVNTITPTATLTVGTPTQTLTLQGDASTSLSAKSGSFTNTLVFAAPALANHTITIPNATGTLAVSASGPLALDAAGNLTCPSCLTTDGSGGGPGVSNINSLSGAITLAGTANQIIISPSGNTLTLSTPQDISTTSSPSFANISIGVNGYVSLAGGATGSRPASPSAGTLYYDTTTNQLLKYNGTKWNSAPKSNTFIVAASNSSQAEKDAADYVASGSDDATTINSALTALPAGGGTVYLIEGTYNLGTTSVSVPDNTTLSGSGAATILRFANNVGAGTYNAITNNNNSTGTHVNIQNLEIDGNKTNQAAGTFYGVYFQNMGTSGDGGSINNVIISNVKNAAVYLNGSNNTTMVNNDIRTNGYGIQLVSSSNNTMTGNLIVGGSNDGFEIINSPNNTITGNTSQGNTNVGILISSTSGNTVSGNTVSGNSTGIYLSSATHNSVSGNTAVGNSSVGIYLSGASSNSIVANKLYDSGSSTDNTGINLSSSSINNSITANDITDTSCTITCYAISIADSSSTGNYLSANHFIGDGTHTAAINDATTSGNTYSSQQLSENGDAVFRNATNSATAFQVQDASANDLLNIDTINQAFQFKTYTDYNNAFTVKNSAGSSVLGVDTQSLTVGTASLVVNDIAGTGDALTVTNGVSTGNVAVFKDNATAVATIADGGAVTFKNSTNSAAAFQIQSATASDTLFTADTTARSASGGNLVKIGNSTGTDGATTILVLDSASANPTSNLSALNGGLFYNSNTNKVEIIENGSVKEICNKTDLGCSSGASATLASAYNNGANQTDSTISLDAARAGVLIKDNATPIVGSLLSVQNSTGTSKYLDVTSAGLAVTGSLDITGTYKVGGTQISSANLSNDSNLAKLAANQTFSGNNTFSGTVLSQNTANSTAAFQIQNATGTSNLLIADTTNSRIGIDKVPTVGVLDVNGAIYQSGNQVCDTSGNCVGTGGGGGVGGGGTAGTIAVFTGSGFTVGDSILSQASGTATVAGNLVVNSGGYISLNGGITSSRPASPTEGMLYYDTNTKSLLVYANGKWQADRSSSTKIVGMGVASGCTGTSPVSSANADGADYVVTSCTSAQTTINSAITALGSTGGTVYLMEGTYIIDGSISTTSNVTIVGSGLSTVIKLKDGINGALVALNQTSSSSTRLAIKNIKLDGNKANNAAGTQRGIDMTNSGSAGNPGVTISNVEVTNFRNEGIYFNGGGINSTVTNNEAISNGAAGIFMSLGATGNNIITGNVSQSNTTDGFMVGGGDNVIENNIAKSNGAAGFNLNSIACSRCSVTGNTADSNTTIGIDLGGTESTVSGNVVENNTTRGINVRSSHNTISNNSVYTNGTDGIFIATSATDNIVANNRLENNTAATANNSITIDQLADNTQVVNNHITDTAGTGCAVGFNGASFASNVYLSGNTYSGTGAASICNAPANAVYDNQLDSSGNFIFRGQGGTALGSLTATSSLSLQGGFTAAALGTPAQPSAVATGGVGTNWGYKITALDGLGETLPSTQRTISGNATLDATHFITLSWTPVGGAIQYKIYRTQAPGTPSSTGLIGTVSGNVQTFVDNGIAATTAVPATNTTGGISVQGNALFKPTTDSATALQLQNAAATETLISIDTTARSASGGNLIKIGNSAGTDTAATVLVVDSNLGALTSNLSALNGGIYYNSSTNHLNAIENGAVKELCNKTDLACGSTPTTTLQNAYDNSSSPATITTSASTKNVVIKAGASNDSTGIFQIQDSTGNSLLNADTVDRFIGINSATPNATLDVTAVAAPFMDGFESSLLSPFNTSGSSLFTVASTGGPNVSHSGTYYAYQATALGGTLSITKTLSAGGTISFWESTNRTNTLGTQTLKLNIDGTICFTKTLTGFGGWTGYTQRSCAVTSGAHTFNWVCTVDCEAAIDDVVITNVSGSTNAATFNAGNVGIGTYFPNATLEVDGTGLIKAATNAAGTFQIQNSTGSAILSVDTSATQTVSVANLAVNAGGSINIAGGNTASRPVSPTAGQIYYDTTTNQLIQYNGTKWVSDHTIATKIVAASNSTQAEKDAADYVASGTGDQATINTALTAAAGGTVYLMEGTYTLSAQVSVPNNTVLSGAGAGTVLTVPNSQNGTYSFIKNSDTATGTKIVIKNLQIDGNKSGQGASGEMTGIYLDHMGSGTTREGATISGVIIKNLNATSFGTNNNGVAVFMVQSENNNINGNTFFGNEGNGLIADSTSINNTISGNNIQNNYNGIWSLGNLNTISGNNVSNAITVSGSNNSVGGNTAATVSLSGGTNTSVTNNAISGGSTGIFITSSSTNNVVSGNAIKGTGSKGIDVFGSSGNLISNNQIYDSGGSFTNNGIYLENSSANNTISGNVITDTACSTTCYAINVSDVGSSKNYLSNNRYSGSAANAASINNAGASTIYANQQTNSTTSTNSDVTDFTTRGSANSATAFQIQNSSGGVVLTQSTTNNYLTINQGGLTVHGIDNPAAPTLASSGTGGTLAAGTYYYRLSAIGLSGETAAIASSPASVTTTGTTSQNTITWSAVANATGYNLFRSTNGTSWKVSALGAVTSAVDNGSNFTWSSVGVPLVGNTTASVNMTAGGLINFDSTGTNSAAAFFNPIDQALYLEAYGSGESININSDKGVKIQDWTDSTTAFQIQNASSQNIVAVDTANTKVTINSSNIGNLSAWTASTSLPTTLNNHASVIANGYVYTFGGFNGTSAIATVYYAPISPTGTIGSWTTSANALPQPLTWPEAVTYNGYVYVTGGNNGGGQSTVYYAKLNQDGSTSTWTTSANALPQGLYHHSVVVLYGYMYVIGGFSGAATLNTVYYAKINPDGSTSTWTTNAVNLPANTQLHASVAANGYIYVMAGSSGAVYYGKVNSTNGSIASWTTSSNPLSSSFIGAKAVVSNGYVYFIGGAGSSDTYYAKLNSDGSTSAWTTNSNQLAQATYYAGIATLNGYIYVMGGFDGGSGHSQVYYSSTSRLQVGSNLDLVGLQGGSYVDSGGLNSGSQGGSIVAGNITGIGALQIQGYSSFSQAVNINGSLAVNSAALFQNSTDSTAAFQIQNAGGASLFSVDTSGSTITLGSASSTPVLLVLGNKNTAGDPTCVNGAIYYNSNTNTFRGCAGGTWSDFAQASVTPVGSVLSYAGSSAPSGYLLADGSAVSRTTYAALFALIGTTYGVGDGSTTFNLPDLRGRVVTGLNTSESGHTDVNALGNSEGLSVGSRTPVHNSTVNDPGHSHTIYNFFGGGVTQSGSLCGCNNAGGTTSTNSSFTGITVGPGGTRPTDTAAYLTLNYIIKY